MLQNKAVKDVVNTYVFMLDYTPFFLSKKVLFMNKCSLNTCIDCSRLKLSMRT